MLLKKVEQERKRKEGRPNEFGKGIFRIYLRKVYGMG
jgi:hypothetical protein